MSPATGTSWQGRCAWRRRAGKLFLAGQERRAGSTACGLHTAARKARRASMHEPGRLQLPCPLSKQQTACSRRATAVCTNLEGRSCCAPQQAAATSLACKVPGPQSAASTRSTTVPLTILTGSVRYRYGFVGSMAMSFETYLGSRAASGDARGRRLEQEASPNKARRSKSSRRGSPAKAALAVTST